MMAFSSPLNNGIPILCVRLGNVFHPIVRKCQDILILFFPNSAHNSEDDLARFDIPRLNPYEPIFLLEELRSNSDQGNHVQSLSLFDAFMIAPKSIDHSLHLPVLASAIFKI